MKLLFAAISLLCICECINAQRLTLVYVGNDENVQTAVKKANEILANKAFYEEIRRRTTPYSNSTRNGIEVADRMEKATQSINVVKKAMPIANAKTKTSDEIKISKKKFGKDSTGKFVLSIAVNTLIHETVHAVDFLTTGDEFTHDGNRPDEQEDTAPWVIGDIAEKMVEDMRSTDTSSISNQHNPLPRSSSTCNPYSLAGSLESYIPIHLTDWY